MSRLSREKKREQNQDAGSVAPRTPIDVHVPAPSGASDADGEGDADGGAVVGASVGGVPLFPAEGEDIQRAVLNRLHRIALAVGHPVLATIHDRRMGYVIPLRMDLDGSSHLTGEPVPAQPGEAPAPPVPPAPPVARDRRTHVLRQVEEPGKEPVRESAPTFPMRAVPEPASPPPPPPAPSGPHRDSAPTFRLRPVPQWATDQRKDEGGPAGEDRPEGTGGGTAPGTVAAPTGAFGPPPRMDPAPDPTRRPDSTRTPEHAHAREAQGFRPVLRHDPTPDLVLAAQLDPDPAPTPPRGFDAVAEAVLGDEPITAPGDGTAPALLAEPMGRINDAVRGGRTEEAARLAAETVAEASATLGAEHPEVLRLQELTAYIAYLAGEPYQALRLSLDLVVVHRRRGDAEAAYGNVQSAATAWRAVRDPARGLELGRELIGLWTALASEGGPAAEELEQLESVRSRMNRLTERAERAEQG